MIYIQFPLRKEYVRVVKWARALSLTLVAPVRIPVVCQSMVGIAYIHLTISTNCETGIGLAYSLHTPLISNFKQNLWRLDHDASLGGNKKNRQTNEKQGFNHYGWLTNVTFWIASFINKIEICYRNTIAVRFKFPDRELWNSLFRNEIKKKTSANGNTFPSTISAGNYRPQHERAKHNSSRNIPYYRLDWWHVAIRCVERSCLEKKFKSSHNFGVKALRFEFQDYAGW